MNYKISSNDYNNGTVNLVCNKFDEISRRVDRLEEELRTRIIYLESQIATSLETQTATPKQKFDLEIFEAIERNNPFL